jgi:two-component system response regulator HydG
MNTIPHVLIVDDDGEFVEILERRLSRRGYRVATCGTIAGARESAGKQRFDVAIVDRTIPGAADLALVAELKTLDPQLPMIVLSGWSGPAYADEARNAGACDYLTKPCSLAAIESALDRALKLRAIESEVGG